MNKRFCTLFFDNNTDIYDDSLESIFKSCVGGAVVIQLSNTDEKNGSFARRKKDVIIEACSLINKYKNTILTILCLPAECEKLKQIFMEKLPCVSFVEISEDRVAGEEAKAYLRMLARKSKISVDKKLFSKLKENTYYNQANLQNMFDDWLSDKLKTKIL